MIHLGEHIEALIALPESEGLSPFDIGQSALDIACAQGLLTEDEASSELAAKEAEDQAKYVMGVD